MLISYDFVDMLLESFKYSTTQINLPQEHTEFMLQWSKLNIPDELLFVDEAENGREAEPHVTVLYGLLSSKPPPELRDIVSSTPIFKIELGPISIFENEEYDVLKLGIISPMLHVLHAKIKSHCRNEYKFPTYLPHATLAYIQKGRGAQFVDKQVFAGEGAPKPNFWVKEILFSGKGDNRVRETISLRRSAKVAESEPFNGIAFSDVQTWLKSRGVRPTRFFSTG